MAGDDEGDYEFDKEVFSLPRIYKIDKAYTTEGRIKTIIAKILPL